MNYLLRHLKTGLTKKQKTTNIYFAEADDLIEVCTYNTDLKKRLATFAGKYPSECRQLDDDGNGCVTYEVRKGRLSFRLTPPYSEERKKAASETAKKKQAISGKGRDETCHPEAIGVVGSALIVWLVLIS